MGVAVSNCGFPTYGFPNASGGGGVAGQGGASGAPAASGTSGSSGDSGNRGGSAGAVGGSGQSGAAGEAGAAGAAGSAGAPCVFPTPVRFPDHCFDGALSPGETGRDCGGECAPCSGTQACAKNTDCASNVCTSGKTCSQLLSLTYMSIVADQVTPTPKFSLSIKYLGQTSTPLQGIRIRYYFNHNGAAEPVLAHSQATLDPGAAQRNLSSSELAYRIYRYPPGPADNNGISTDSVLEISFPSSASLTNNALLNLTQDIVAGSADPSLSFTQTTHYSFFNGANANEKVAVYRGDQLIWGVPPPLSELPACAFVAGVNLGGSTVSVDSQPEQASSEARVVYSGATFSGKTSLVPPTDASTTSLVSTGFTLGSATAAWPVPNGKYWAYAWLTSDVSASSGQLMIQDNAEDRFFGVAPNGDLAWAKVGPYQIDVLGGSVKLSATGTVNLAGVELYAVAP